MLRLCSRVNYKQISAVFRSFYRTFSVLLVFLVFNVWKCILFVFGQHICMEHHFDCLFCISVFLYFLCFLYILFFMYFMWELLLAKRNAISLAKIRQIFLYIFFFLCCHVFPWYIPWYIRPAAQQISQCCRI